MKFEKIAASLIIALGLLSLGLCLRSGINSFASRERSVSVRGLCERTVTANKVTWPLCYQALGNELPELYASVERNNKAIYRFLIDNAIDSAEISIGAPSITDRLANNYSSQDQLYRYSAQVVLTVTTDKVEQVNALIKRQGELLREGVSLSSDNWQYPAPIYEYTDLNAIKPDMIAEATANARTAAQKFADDSGSKVGRIKNAQQGQFSIDDRDPYTPWVKTIRVVTYLDYYIED